MTIAKELDSTCGISDEELQQRYNESIRIDDDVCDILPIYNNTTNPFRIFKKRKGKKGSMFVAWNMVQLWCSKFTIGIVW